MATEKKSGQKRQAAHPATQCQVKNPQHTSPVSIAIRDQDLYERVV